MSTNQVKGDSIDSQLKRGGRAGAAVYRATQPSVKGGGAGGLSPSASAPPQTNPVPNHSVQPALRPSTPGNAGGRRKTNGHGWQSSNAANGEGVLQTSQQGHRQQQIAGLSSVPAARRPVLNNGAMSKQPPTTPEPVSPSLALKDTGRSTGQPALTFQFGSVSPAFVHNAGMQIPARTSSAPPNLDEQKREQAQFEAARAATGNKILAGAHHGPVLDHSTISSQPQHHLPAQLAPPQPPLPVRQLHMQMPLHVVGSQPQGTVQQPLQQPVLQHGLVQQSYAQGTKFQQPPVMASQAQVATSMVGPQQMVSQISHQLGPQIGGPVAPPGMPQYPFFQPRTNRAIKIVNPETQEEVRFDQKSKRIDVTESRPPVLSSAPLSGRVLGPQQPRPSVSYTGGHPQMNMNHYPSSQAVPFASGTPFFPQTSGDSQRYIYGSQGSSYRTPTIPSGSKVPSGPPATIDASTVAAADVSSCEPTSEVVGVSEDQGSGNNVTSLDSEAPNSQGDIAPSEALGAAEGTVEGVQDVGSVEGVQDVGSVEGVQAVGVVISLTSDGRSTESHVLNPSSALDGVGLLNSTESLNTDDVQEGVSNSMVEAINGTLELNKPNFSDGAAGSDSLEVCKGSCDLNKTVSTDVDITSASPSLQEQQCEKKHENQVVLSSEKLMTEGGKSLESAVSTAVDNDKQPSDLDGRISSLESEDGENVNTTEPSVVSPVAADLGQGDNDNKDEYMQQALSEVVEVKQGNKKKNKKKLFAKADAAGSTADLYNAYKAPDEKKQEQVKPVELPEAEAKFDKKPSVQEQVPKELDDWEDAADLPSPSPNLRGDDQEDTSHKKYSRDFLLTFKDQHLDLPSDFEVRPDFAEYLLFPQTDLAGSGRIPDRQARRTVGGLDEDRWIKQPITPSSGRAQDVRGVAQMAGFRPGGPGIMPPGIRFPQPMMVPTLPSRGVDADRWTHAPQKGLIPSPQTPLPAIHKAEKKYEVGKVTDEEQSKQRQVKGILNKLTPQNFEKLFEQVREVGIETASTLTGVIAQIFDKAVMEPTFCETYARFCVQLSVALPEFNEDEQKITFKRVLLNKCQEEFERGKREEEEAGKIEEGESSTPEQREEKRVKARRRMLGNIRFIGELYKNSMLTERIMHECIKALLGEYQNPDDEDVEALCKLMTTIGHLIDHPKAKAHIDAYFDRILELADNQKLSSRLRFGLKDVIDLRKNGWHQRRKVEGPKKIEEVHRDAAQERLAQTSRDRFSRGMSMNNRRMPPSPVAMAAMSPMGGPRGMPNRQDVRVEDPFYMDNRTMPMPMPVPQRTEDITLGPQGGLGRGAVRGPLSSGRSALGDVPTKLHMDYRRPGTAPSMDRGPYAGREDFPSRATGVFGAAERPLLDRPMTAERLGPVKEHRGLERSSSDRLAGYSNMVDRPSTPPTPAAQVPQSPALTEEQLKKKIDLAIEEYYSARDVKEAVQCVEELRRPEFHSTLVSRWVSESFERKDVERDLLVKLILYLKSIEPPLLTYEQLREGFVSVLSLVEDTVMDVPRAPDYLGSIMGKLVVQGVFALAEVGKFVKEGGMEKDSLLMSGDALNIFGSVLDTIRKEKGEGEMIELYTSSGVGIDDFVANPKSGELDEFLRRKNLLCLNPVLTVEAYLKDALDRNQPLPEILKWLETNAASLFLDAGFLRMVMTEVLNHCVLPLPNGDYENALKGRTRRYSDLLKRFTSGNSKVAAASQKQYIAAVQLFAHAHGHPPGLMTVLFKHFYTDEIISENAFFKWQDDVNDTTPGRDKAIREVGKWLVWLAEAPEEAGDD